MSECAITDNRDLDKLNKNTLQTKWGTFKLWVCPPQVTQLCMSWRLTSLARSLQSYPLHWNSGRRPITGAANSGARSSPGII